MMPYQVCGLKLNFANKRLWESRKRNTLFYAGPIKIRWDGKDQSIKTKQCASHLILGTRHRLCAIQIHQASYDLQGKLTVTHCFAYIDFWDSTLASHHRIYLSICVRCTFKGLSLSLFLPPSLYYDSDSVLIYTSHNYIWCICDCFSLIDALLYTWRMVKSETYLHVEVATRRPYNWMPCCNTCRTVTVVCFMVITSHLAL